MSEARAIVIRPFMESDTEAVAALMTELGYPTSPTQMAERMKRIAGRSDHATLIADHDGRVVGMVGATVAPTWEHDTPTARIVALVVSETARNRGTGARLAAAAEAWARAQGAGRLSLTTHVRRMEAHAFYRRRGYEETGKRFVRDLTRG